MSKFSFVRLFISAINERRQNGDEIGAILLKSSILDNKNLYCTNFGCEYLYKHVMTHNNSTTVTYGDIYSFFCEMASYCKDWVSIDEDNYGIEVLKLSNKALLFLADIFSASNT